MKTVLLRFGAVLPFASISPAAFAEIDKGGVLNEVSDRFLTESSNWATTITDHASWLFWTLVVISMVWTFGMMAFRKADIGEFFAEFTRFTITTGFFWWLLINGPGFAMDIINSLRNIAAEASGLPRGLNPSTPIDIAFDIIAKAASSYSITSPMDNLSIFLTTLAILACMAIVAANVLLALVTAWIIAYAGIFVLGFGGSRWTSDIAVNYFMKCFNDILRFNNVAVLAIRQRNLLFPFGDLVEPFPAGCRVRRVIMFSQEFNCILKGSLGFADDRQIDHYVFVDGRRIDVDLDDFSIGSKSINCAGNTVIEAHAHGDQQIAMADSHIGII